MNERMEKMEKERDERIASLKKEVEAEREKRDILEHRVTGLKLELQAVERKRSDQSQAMFKKPTIDAQIDERVKPLKKTITDAVTSIVSGDVEERISQAKAEFQDQVMAIDKGFQEWWAGAQQEAKLVQVDSLLQRVAALEKQIIPTGPRSQTSQHSAPSTDPRQRPAVPSSNRLPNLPSSSRLPPHAPSAPSASPLHSPLPTPIEPSTGSSTSSTSAAPEYVTLAQLHASREKSVKELKAFEAKCWQEVGKLKKQVDKLSSNSIEQGSPAGSPIESPRKNARLGSGDEPPSKRVKTANSAVPVAATMTAEETRATKEAVAKILDLETSISILKQALQAAQGEIAKLTKLESSVSNLEERSVKAEADRQEYLKRMADGDKSTGRRAEAELKKTNTRIEQHLREFKTLETNVNKKFSEFEASSSGQNSKVFSDELEEEWEEKIRGLQSDCVSLKQQLVEVTTQVCSFRSLCS